MNKYERDLDTLKVIRLHYLSGSLKVSMRIVEKNYKELLEKFSQLPSKESLLNKYGAQKQEEVWELINTIYGDEL